MKDVETKEKFIQLRAKGYSFDKISEQVGVSKPTLIKWNSEFSKEIANARFFETESLLERYHLMKSARLDTFSKLLSDSLHELQKRAIDQLTTKELLNLIGYLESRLTKETESINYITDKITPPWDMLDCHPVKIHLFD